MNYKEKLRTTNIKPPPIINQTCEALGQWGKTYYPNLSWRDRITKYLELYPFGISVELAKKLYTVNQIMRQGVKGNETNQR